MIIYDHIETFNIFFKMDQFVITNNNLKPHLHDHIITTAKY